MKEKRNVSLVEVAEATGVSRQALYKWENNSINRFEVRVIDALCEYFGVQPGDLFHYVKPEGGKSGKITFKAEPYEDGKSIKLSIKADAGVDDVLKTMMTPAQLEKAKGNKKSRKKKPAA